MQFVRMRSVGPEGGTAGVGEADEHMNIYDAVRRWVVLLVAEVLQITAGAAELLLRSQPRWVAQLQLLAAELRAGQKPRSAVADPTNGETEIFDSDEPGAAGMPQILSSYAILNCAMRDLEAHGLALDQQLTERMRREWTADSIVGYLQSCDAQLHEKVTLALNQAAEALGVPERAGQRPQQSKNSASATPRRAARAPR